MISEASLVRPPIFVIIRASTKIDLKTGFCELKTGFSRNQRQMRDHVTDLLSSRTKELRSFSRTGKLFSRTRKYFHTIEASCIQSAIKGFRASLKESIYLLNDRAQRGPSLRIFLISPVGEQNGEKFLSANSLCKQCKWDFKKSVVGQEKSEKCADGVIRLRIE